MIFDSWLALPTGILIAAVSSTVGIGGGILWMPFLIIILKLRPDTAVVTSLLIQTAGMGSGTVAFWLKRQIDVRLMLFLLAVTIPGITIGALLTRILAPVYLELTLGLLTLSTAFIFVSASQRYGEEGKVRSDINRPDASVLRLVQWLWPAVCSVSALANGWSHSCETSCH